MCNILLFKVTDPNSGYHIMVDNGGYVPRLVGRWTVQCSLEIDRTLSIIDTWWHPVAKQSLRLQAGDSMMSIVDVSRDILAPLLMLPESFWHQFSKPQTHVPIVYLWRNSQSQPMNIKVHMSRWQLWLTIAEKVEATGLNVIDDYMTKLSISSDLIQ